MPRMIHADAMFRSPCPKTKRLLHHYIDRNRTTDGNVSMVLHVPFPRGADDEASIDQDVSVRFREGRRDGSLRDVVLIEWAPDGPYPAFSGTLRVCPEIDARFSRIEIDGVYDAPCSLLGHAFDVVVGTRMANASISDLIEKLAAEFAFSNPALALR